MSVGALKKLLVVLNLVAILALGATAWGFWNHRQYLNGPHEWPDFAFTAAVITDSVGQIGDTNMTLGLFPVEVEKKPTEEKPAEEEIIGVLQKLGTITGAIVSYPPYDQHSSDRPAIIFKLREGGTIRTLALGEAIETRPHPKYKGAEFAIPYRYQFIACEQDKDNPRVTNFVFDMRCDKTDIQKVPWQGDVEAHALKMGAALPNGDGKLDINEKGGTVVSESEIERQRLERAEQAKKAAEARASKEPTKVETVKVNPDQVLPTAGKGDVPDDFYEERDGTWMPTNRGSEYLKDNWKKAVEETRTSTYRNPDTGAKEGVLITRIPRGSVASKFGLYPDDVIQMVNGRTVRSKSEAINVVKNEIDVKKRKIIEVRILRNGKPVVKRYDTRDPDTRKAARDLR